MPQAGQRTDPLGAQSFAVEIEGIAVAQFAEVTGLGSSIDVIEYREGAEPLTVRKLPGLRKFTNIVLKRGVTRNRELWDWYRESLGGTVQRRNGSVVLLDEERNAVLRWNFRDGWICRFDGPSLRAGSNDVAIETIEIAHEGLELA